VAGRGAPRSRRTTAGATGAIRAVPSDRPYPAGMSLVADMDLAVLADGRRLLGGTPTRLLRLGPRAGAAARRLLDGEPVSADPAERALARRLVSAGLAHPDHTRSTGADRSLVTVVVPVRDRPAPLARLLEAVRGLRCVVVDDGSVDAGAIEGAARAAGARYLGLATSVGPAGARNAGIAVADTPFVAFVDSDCRPSSGWLEPLLAHFDDPAVAVVAPRVTAADGAGWLVRYEAARSPLDLGDRPGLVRPRTRVPYVPTAALVVRREVFSNPCFDESLRGGEDVDFVWRTVAAGWDVRYEPTSTVAHHADRSWLEWATRRAFYGATAGPLSRRHPGEITAVRLPGWIALSGSLLLARRPLAAVACPLAAGGLLARRLRGVVDEPTALATHLIARALTQGTAPVVTSAVRAWSPALVAGLGVRRLRRAVLVAFGAAAFADWCRRRPRLDPARYLAAHAADDLSYGLGLWWGCWRSRTLRPLLAQVTIGWRRPAPPARRDDRVQTGVPSASR
jgi:mycofactocin glycosyltransferase